MKYSTLDLRTGELKAGIGKEIFRAFITRNPADGVAHLNLRISFPIYNPQTGKTFWLSSETCVDYHSADEIHQYLEKWKNKDALYRTGLNLDRSVSFTNDWIESENIPCKKIRIVMPNFGDKPPKKALTKLNHKNVKLLCEYINEFLENECDNDIEDAKVDRNVDPRTKELRDMIRCHEAKIEELYNRIGDAREELCKLLHTNDQDEEEIMEILGIETREVELTE